MSDEGADDEDEEVEEQVPEKRSASASTQRSASRPMEQREHEHEDGQLAPAAGTCTPPEARSVSAPASRLVVCFP